MSTLAEFVLARIAEDEGAVRAVDPVHWSELRYITPGYTLERVLAECEAKRRIVALYAEHADYDNEEESYEHATGRIVGLGEAVRLLAEVHGDHPDYRNEWRPAS